MGSRIGRMFGPRRKSFRYSFARCCNSTSNDELMSVNTFTILPIDAWSQFLCIATLTKAVSMMPCVTSSVSWNSGTKRSTYCDAGMGSKYPNSPMQYDIARSMSSFDAPSSRNLTNINCAVRP